MTRKPFNTTGELNLARVVQHKVQRPLLRSSCLSLFPGKTELRFSHVLPALFVLMEVTSIFGNMDYIQQKTHLPVYVTAFKKATIKEQIV